jgi:hypothetical protein
MCDTINTDALLEFLLISLGDMLGVCLYSREVDLDYIIS